VAHHASDVDVIAVHDASGVGHNLVSAVHAPAQASA
jgi:hypothetical protein